MTLSARRGGIIILFSFVLAMVLTLLPLPEWARLYRPQWYTLVLIYWTMATPHRVGVGVGWATGLVVDVTTGTLLGQHALALAIIAYITHKLHQRVRLFPLWQQSLTVLGLLLLEKLTSLWVMGAISQPAPLTLFWAPPLVGALLWPWVFIVLRDLRRRFQVS
jgi:rod shape-determining protein MreD